MKCPMQVHSYQSMVNGSIIFETAECSEKECALWDENNNCCSRNTAKSVTNVDARVDL